LAEGDGASICFAYISSRYLPVPFPLRYYYRSINKILQTNFFSPIRASALTFSGLPRQRSLVNQGSPFFQQRRRDSHNPRPWPASNPSIHGPIRLCASRESPYLHLHTIRSINGPVADTQHEQGDVHHPSTARRRRNSSLPKKVRPVHSHLDDNSGNTSNQVICRDISGRHKEILSEIFYFTKNPYIPPEVEAIQEQVAATDDLREFLRINDLDRCLLPKFDGAPDTVYSGHVFQETTLPTVQNVAVNATVEPQSSTTPTVSKTTVPQTPATPQTNTSSAVPAQPPSSGSGRMVTRVSSGAIRHKSVGELLGQQEVPIPPS